MSVKYPKLLIVSHNSFSTSANNGKTLESIFGDFPKDNLAQLFFSMNEYPDFEFCCNYFKITDMDILKSYFRNTNVGNSVNPSNKETFDLQANMISKPKSKFFFNLLKRIFKKSFFLRDLLWASSRWNTASMFSWIEKFNPDIIFFVGGRNSFSHDIAREISVKSAIPLTVFFTDDYLLYPVYHTLFGSMIKRRILGFYKKTISHTSLNFVIGEKMKNDYTSFFDKEFHCIMNSVKIQPYTAPVRKKNNTIAISFFGGLHLNRWKTICLLAEQLNRSKLNFQITVYTTTQCNSEMSREFLRVGIINAGAVYGSMLEKELLNSDILLHVESDDKYNRALTRLSVSTKIPEYLSAGRCVLAVGPEEVASMQLIYENRLGIYISSDRMKVSGLDDLTISELSCFETRVEYGRKGYEYASANFNVFKARTKILNLINTIL